MDKFKTMTLDDRINQMKEDYNTEWWRASKIDNYDLKNKLLRVGCRPIKRKLMKCQNRLANNDNYASCSELKGELSKCHETLYMVYYNTKKEATVNKNV